MLRYCQTQGDRTQTKNQVARSETSTKNKVLAELLQEHIELNKTWGPLTHRWVPHDIRDQVVDTVRSWSERTDLHLKDILQWTDIHSSTFNKWTRCNGKAYEHNGKVPRDHWLTDQEKQAIIQYHFDHPLNGYRRLICMMMDGNMRKRTPVY